MDSKEPRVIPSLPWKKRLLFSSFALLVTLLILELGIRAYFAYKVGPSVLLYGTRFHQGKILSASQSSIQHRAARPEAKEVRAKMTRREWKNRRTVITHPNKLDGYSKYFPNQKRFDFDIETEERFEVMINNRGFRGRDIADRKNPGVIRIVALGASSTFGYFDRDDETYPVYLEQSLNERCSGDIRFEVINLGIPHLRSTNIYALFLAEVIRLDPDGVTFYEGNNDTGRIKERLNKQSLVRSGIRKAGKVSISVGLIDSLLGSWSKTRYSPVEFKKHAQVISNDFIDNISKIYLESKKQGIVFIVANQQGNSQSIERRMLKGLTYQEEREKIQAKMLQSKELRPRELRFLTHAILMKDLTAWARANQVPFVDVVARLDQDRDVLVSWVHLSPRGNRMVAEAFADEILRHTCRK